MGKKREDFTICSPIAGGVIALMTLLFGAGTVQAVSVLNSCSTNCHGAPPRDATRKSNPHFGSQSSAFPGNHGNHLPAVPAASACGICHTPVSATDFGHQNNVIGMANSLKGYSSATARAKYDKGVFFNQTSIPNLTIARCSNVNCHFERQTPLWGTAASATTCSSCHDLIPATLAHPKHTVITACSTCHSDHGLDANPFMHATSAGRAIVVKTGSYAGSNNRYLPSQTGRITGTCSTVACHGSGTLLPWSGTLWSTTDQCGTCHSSSAAGAITQAVPFYGTAYPTKVTLNTNAKVGAHTNHMTSQALGISASTACTDCHGTVTLATATHMTGTTNLVWSALATRNGALVPAYTAATGTCANTYCHGASMPGGDTSGTNRAPTWINPNYLPATISAAACGLCHGFPPPTASGHPAVTIPAGFPATATIGTTCNCHSNINTAGNSYATIFIDPALHINGISEPTASGHAVPFYAHSTPPFTSCTGCHNASAAGPYPAATAGAAPNCRGCHATADPTVTTTGCTSCHSIPPSGTVRPNVAGSHVKHSAVGCTTCHSGAGSGSGASHGPGNKGTNPAVDNVIFSGTLAGASAAWVAATKTCSTTYCHGATLTGGTSKSPVWGTILTGCALCHGDPPATATHTGVTVTQCINCHTHVNAAGTGFSNATLHINGTVEASGSCISCHASAQTGTHGTPRDAVTTEFGLAWGHKKTGRGAVTDADCIVCHLEGNYTTQSASALHKDGNIDLRDPDGVGEVAITNISGGAFTFTKFALSFAAGSRTTTGHTSNTDIANVITQKFCLKCHDSTGATNTTARSGVAPTQYLPFGTGSQNGAAYTVGLSAGVVGGVVNVDSMFLTTNSTFHPVKGPQNNRYASGTRMAVPYGVTKTAIADGIVMNCFDCHNAPVPLTSRTVAAHGSTAPNAYRGTVYDTSNTLCKVCHTGYTGTTSHHGTGSAFASNTNSGMTTYLTNQCQRCHASTNTAVRPVRAEDAHGFNRFAGTGTDAMWPRGAAETYRPYAFMRNTTQWTTTSWKPLSGTGVPAGSATCGGSMSASGCGDNMTTYTPGGTY